MKEQEKACQRRIKKGSGKQEIKWRIQQENKPIKSGSTKSERAA